MQVPTLVFLKLIVKKMSKFLVLQTIVEASLEDFIIVLDLLFF